MAKPFLKWAGGKRQLIGEIEARLPKDFEKCERYVEPFIGGGALFFHFQDKYDFDEIHIADLNPELILCYQQLQKRAGRVWFFLSKLIKSYPTTIEDRKPRFYDIRNEWNSKVEKIDQMTLDAKSFRVAQTIFLNKTCFNGLFRVNSKGEFNVPTGSYVRPSFPTKDDLMEVKKSLRGVIIHLAPFEQCVNWVNENTFVYFDPPYRPLSETANFVSYSKGDFDDDDQRSLAGVFRQLDEAGARLLLSNSDPKNTNPNDEFFDNLYSKFTIERVSANRAINSKGSKRGPINELLIRNYP